MSRDNHTSSKPKAKEFTAFIGNVSYDYTSDQLRDALVNDLNLAPLEVRVVVDRETGRGRGFAFANFPSPELLDHAIEEISGFELEGRKLRANYAEQKEPRNPPRHASGPRNGPRAPAKGEPATAGTRRDSQYAKTWADGQDE